MMAVERQRKIMDLIETQGSVRVSEVSTLFGVTPETVRRDLDLLETEGKLIRSHGGAVRVSSDQYDLSYIERETLNAREKADIANEAVALIEPNDSLVLDASSSAVYLARALPDFPLTVLTNSIPVMQELANKDRIQVISTGGTLRTTSMSLVGPMAEATLSEYHVNKAFVSCKGIDHNGLSESDELQALIKRKMVAIAQNSYVLVDHTKIGRTALVHSVGFADLNGIIMNSAVEEATVTWLKQLGLEVNIAKR